MPASSAEATDPLESSPPYDGRPVEPETRLNNASRKEPDAPHNPIEWAPDVFATVSGGGKLKDTLPISVLCYLNAGVF